MSRLTNSTSRYADNAGSKLLLLVIMMTPLIGSATQFRLETIAEYLNTQNSNSVMSKTEETSDQSGQIKGGSIWLKDKETVACSPYPRCKYRSDEFIFGKKK